MRREPGRRAIEHGSTSTWARLRVLPRPVLLLGLLLLLSALAPVAAEVASVLGTADGPAWLGALARHPVIAGGVPLVVALGVLLVLERPRSASPVGYARQLRDRLVAVQAEFDGALRRRSREEDEEERHAPEPQPSEH
jgi:hypothetical protein